MLTEKSRSDPPLCNIQILGLQDCHGSFCSRQSNRIGVTKVGYIRCVRFRFAAECLKARRAPIWLKKWNMLCYAQVLDFFVSYISISTGCSSFEIFFLIFASYKWKLYFVIRLFHIKAISLQVLYFEGYLLP